MSESLESPDHVKISRASAIKLDFVPGKLYRNSPLYCANLLLTYDERTSHSGCLANCSYCGLARGRGDRTEDSFIRVGWPTAELEEVKERLRGHDEIEIVCVGMIVHRDAVEDTVEIVSELSDLEHDIALLSCPRVMDREDFQRIADAGADKCDIAFDAATREVFEAHRGSGVDGPLSWDHYWDSMEAAADVFGEGNSGSHFIAGLGETERELLEAIQRVRDLGGENHLFNFFPHEGTALEDADMCEAGHWRRVQLARYLIDNDYLRAEDVQYDGEVIDGFGLPDEELQSIIDSGRPFMTSGCSAGGHECACNRPAGDSGPTDIRSFPFPPDREDMRMIRDQLWSRGTWDGERSGSPEEEFGVVTSDE